MENIHLSSVVFDKIKNNFPLTTGIHSLDQCLDGFKPGCLYTISSSDDSVCSYLIYNTLFSQDIFNNACLFISTKSNQQEIAEVMIKREFGSLLNNPKSIPDAKRRFEIYQKTYSKAKIFFSGKTNEIYEIKLQISKLNRQIPINIIFVDGANLLKSQSDRNPGNQKDYETERAVISLNELARELNIPIIISCPVDESKKQNYWVEDTLLDISKYVFNIELQGQTTENSFINGILKVHKRDIGIVKNIPLLFNPEYKNFYEA